MRAPCFAARVGVLCLLLGTACGSAPRGRVLLVGIDGATLRMVTPLIEAGRLPHLAALARDGFGGPLRAHEPLLSPRIWTSIATGMDPRRHGIVSFAWPDAAGVRQLYRSSDRRVPALWNIASAAGLSVVVVNWWNTYPVEKVRGAMVSDHVLAMEIQGRRALTGAEPPTPASLAWPRAWNARLPQLLRDDAPLTRVANPFAQRERFAAWMNSEALARRYENDADIARIALALEAALSPDLLMVFLPGIDRVSHVLWAAVEPTSAYADPPRMDAEQRSAAAEALRLYYVYSDALIGRLMQRYGERDLVLVVSDHGFEAGRALGFLSGVHKSPGARDGVIFARGPGIVAGAGEPAASVNDVTPTVLAWLGLPVADDMDGRVAHFLAGAAPARVASYAGLPVERLESAVSVTEREVLAELRSLGYLDDAGGAAVTP